ncbi:uncharacterized protein LOC144927709 isoform X1 [Branchiostoma floridae x Branchiostoma belcheri]
MSECTTGRIAIVCTLIVDPIKVKEGGVVFFEFLLLFLIPSLVLLQAVVQHSFIANTSLLSRHEQMGVYSWAAKQLTPACCPDQVMRRRVESLFQGRFMEFKGQLSNMALQLTPASCPDMSR